VRKKHAHITEANRDVQWGIEKKRKSYIHSQYDDKEGFTRRHVMHENALWIRGDMLFKIYCW